MLWDIFCKVIDNHGDIGVCWRLGVQLAAHGEDVRLWVDDASALRWMAPQGAKGVEVLPWATQAQAQPADVVIEAFGCELEPDFQAALAARARRSGRQPCWINLEYLTAERFAERNHLLPSPVLAGPARGLTKHFFYPGFVAGTGGLLREADLPQRQAQFSAADWLGRQGIARRPGARLASLFCYEPAALPQWLAQLARGATPTQLLVTAGRAAAAVQDALRRSEAAGDMKLEGSALSIEWLPLLSQQDFDHLLWSCDLNFVRGEDSLVRALWAGRPFVWQIYPQDDEAHHAKLAAFLDWLQADASWRRFHWWWNAAGGPPAPLECETWTAGARAARQCLLAQADLVSQLRQFVAEPCEARR